MSDEQHLWVLTAEKINSLQVETIDALIKRAKAAHFVNVKVRINGKDEEYEADWLKHLRRTQMSTDIDRLNRLVWLREADIEAGNRVLRAICESSVNGRNVLEGIDKGVADLARYRLGIEVTHE